MLDILFPIKCFSCGRKLINNTNKSLKFNMICPDCTGTIKPIHQEGGKKCKKCCDELYISNLDYCYNCSRTDYSFKSNTSLFYYKDPIIQKLMQLFKFKSNLYAGNDLYLIIKPEIDKFFIEKDYDIVLITPLSKESYKIRGFNQVEFLLKKCGIPFMDSLIRKKHKKHQSELSANERREWIKGQFDFKTNFDFTGKSVIIIDDIFTTGNTVNEISSIVKNNLAETVDVLTFFKD